MSLLKSNIFSEQDNYWMKTAVSYARHGIGFTGYNPSVGCAIVKDNELISISRTQDGGRPHAEEKAINLAGNKTIGSTLYVTLEPCAHLSKISSCVDLILSAKIKKVVIGCIDPDIRTNGSSISKLKHYGIEVLSGCLVDEIEETLIGFKNRINKNKPYITVKIASSLDGNISLKNGKSKWITGENTRQYIHLLRARNNALLTGFGTIDFDDPLLNCRKTGLDHQSPLIFILDSKLSIDINSKVFRNKNNVIILTTDDHDKSKAEKLLKNDISFQVLKKNINGNVEVFDVLKLLNKFKINNLLIESGPKIITSFFKNKLIDKIVLCRSGKLFGADSISFLSSLNLKRISNVNDFYLKESFTIDEDIIEHWESKII